MLVLVEVTTGRIIEEGEIVTDLHDESEKPKKGRYTGWMPPHTKNEKGLAYVQFPGIEWEDSMFPERIGAKLVDL